MNSYISKKEKKRLIVLTDISSITAGFKEPDDAQSFIRLLLYANEFDIEGLIASYSVHWKDEGGVKPEYLEAVVKEYQKVRENLLLHDSQYPSYEYLLSCIKSGNPKCGLAEVGANKDTQGSDHIISVVDRPDPRPVWIIIWGGPTDLAQAIWKVESERTAEEFAAFKSKILVYSIADQYDETGPWLRQNHPDIFYITSYKALRGMYRGGDTSLLSPQWLKANVCNNHGPLGAMYPIYDGGDIFSGRIGKVEGIKEGDTPSFLYLIPNGLSDPMKPSWGSWGGRFYGTGKQFFDDMDTYEEEIDEMASVYKWRKAYQADFQARMDWCVKPFKESNHAPVVVIDQEIEQTVLSGTEVILSAKGSYDPDGDGLSFSWDFYRDASSFKGQLELKNKNSMEVSFIAPEVVYFPKTIHMILTVKDNGEPALTSYKRVVVTVDPKWRR